MTLAFWKSRMSLLTVILAAVAIGSSLLLAPWCRPVESPVVAWESDDLRDQHDDDGVRQAALQGRPTEPSGPLAGGDERGAAEEADPEQDVDFPNGTDFASSPRLMVKAALRAFREGEPALGIRLLKKAVPGLPPNIYQEEVRMNLACALLEHAGAKEGLLYVADFFSDAAQYSRTGKRIPRYRRSLFSRGFRTFPTGPAGHSLRSLYEYSHNQIHAPLPEAAEVHSYLHFAAELRRKLEALREEEVSADERKLFEALVAFADVNALISRHGVNAKDEARSRVSGFIAMYDSAEDARVQHYVGYFRRQYPECIENSEQEPASD